MVWIYLHSGGDKMTILIGGIAAVVLGALGAAIFWSPILSVLAGFVPAFLIIGGALAIYFGIDEIRHPAPTPQPVREPVVDKPEPQEATLKAEDEGAATRWWLLSYSAQNVEVVREKGLLGLPKDREDTLQEKIKIGDHVVLYALAPESQFAGIVEVTGAPARPAEMPFKPQKEGEEWELCREVRAVRIPPADAWVEAKGLFEELDLLEEARKEEKDLARSFAAKLRDILPLSSADYQTISRALGT
jgi:predicted RNA-binding protein